MMTLCSGSLLVNFVVFCWSDLMFGTGLIQELESLDVELASNESAKGIDRDGVSLSVISFLSSSK